MSIDLFKKFIVDHSSVRLKGWRIWGNLYAVTPAPILTDPLCTASKSSARQRNACSSSTTKTSASASSSTAVSSKNTSKSKAKGAVYLACWIVNKCKIKCVK